MEGTPKLIAFDIDGTLTESASLIERDMARLLAGLFATKKVAAVSGSTLAQFRKQFLVHFELGDKLENLYLLTTDGANLYEYKENDWHALYEHRLSAPQKEMIMKAFEETFAEVGFQKPENPKGPILEDRDTQIAFAGLGRDASLAEKQVWDPDHQKREKIAEVLRTKLPDFAINIGGTTHIEVTDKGIDKGYGLKKLMEHLGVSPEETVYVGDAIYPGGNDEDVMSLGVALKAVTGPDETKELIRSFLMK